MFMIMGDRDVTQDDTAANTEVASGRSVTDALGVSGGSVQQDVWVAQAALAAFEALTR
jgi:hypothetical protein